MDEQDSRWETPPETSFGIRIMWMLAVGALCGFIAGVVLAGLLVQDWAPINASNPPIVASIAGLIAGVFVFLVLLYQDGSSQELSPEDEPYWGDDFDDVNPPSNS